MPQPHTYAPPLGIQAFGCLIEVGHPGELACGAFNADFDGDQMALSTCRGR